jgi:DNA-binding NarL/FixJ family response regulator
LFFSDHAQLAVVYELADTFSGSGAPVFLLFIPLNYCLQRRKNASAVAGVVSLWFLANAVSNFLTPDLASGLSAAAAPAVAFTLSIATVAWLFYLSGEHNRVYFRALIEEHRLRLKSLELEASEAIEKALFSEEERKVALLLIEGDTKRDISRRLNMPSAEVGVRIAAIRDKLVSVNDADPVIAVAVREYKLTRRETEMLRCLRRGMTNPQLADEMFITEGTVKVHVHNLLGKLNVETRHHIGAWAESLAEKS